MMNICHFDTAMVFSTVSRISQEMATSELHFTMSCQCAILTLMLLHYNYI